VRDRLELIARSDDRSLSAEVRIGLLARVWQFDAERVRIAHMGGRDYEMVAEQVSGLNAKVADLIERMAEAEKVNARLEAAALTTARSLQEISRHWDAVYEAMRRAEEGTGAVDDLQREQYGASPQEND
jgi:predicted nuclease with TOPRIM domain